VRYKIDNMTVPTQAQGLEALVTRPTSDPAPKQWVQYVKPELLVDPWGKKYQYRNPGKQNPTGYDIFTLAPDGSEIGNW
jgi:general secretion pathway protein G